MMNEPVKPIKILDKDANMWAMILHLSQLGNFVVPFSGFVAPIVIWQLKKDEHPAIDEHGKNVANWLISLVIYSLVCGILVFFVIGIFLAILLTLVHVIFVIIGGLKANDGIAWEYPMSIKFF